MGFFCDFRISIFKLLVAVPSYFPFSNNPFSKDYCFIVFPIYCIKKNFIITVGFFIRKNFPEIIHRSAHWKQIFFSINFKVEQIYLRHIVFSLFLQKYQKPILKSSRMRLPFSLAIPYGTICSTVKKRTLKSIFSAKVYPAIISRPLKFVSLPSADPAFE